MHCRRLFHAVPEAPELAVRNVIRHVPNVTSQFFSKPEFVVKGSGSVLEIRLPSSVELIAKRNSLVGVLGMSAGSKPFVSRLQLAKALLTSWIGNQPLLNQSIVGSSPLTCILGAENRFINQVELDGSIDWVVRSPLLAYTGQQLSISARLGWSLRAVAPFSHTLVSGRGLIAWTTPASTVQLLVPEGESVLVHSRHLSAFTVDTNAAFRPSTLTKVDFQFAPLQSSLEPTKTTNNPRNLWSKLTKSLRSFNYHLNRLVSQLTRAGNSGHFVEIWGPSTVLVSSSAKLVRQISAQTKSASDVLEK